MGDYKKRNYEKSKKITSLIRSKHIKPQTITECVSLDQYAIICGWYRRQSNMKLFVLQMSTEWVRLELVISHETNRNYE